MDDHFLHVEIGDEVEILSTSWSSDIYKLLPLSHIEGDFKGRIVTVTGFHTKNSLYGSYQALQFKDRERNFYLVPTKSIVRVVNPQMVTFSKSRYLEFDRKVTTIPNRVHHKV